LRAAARKAKGAAATVIDTGANIMPRVLVRLRDRYPDASRMTRWRIRQQPDHPSGIDHLGTEWFYEDELDAYDESRRRLTPKRSTDETEAQ
jgi:hypothetical protein